MIRIFGAMVGCTDENNTHTRMVWCVEDDAEKAYGWAMCECLRLFPEKEGYYGHQADVAELSEEFLLRDKRIEQKILDKDCEIAILAGIADNLHAMVKATQAMGYEWDGTNKLWVPF